MPGVGQIRWKSKPPLYWTTLLVMFVILCFLLVGTHSMLPRIGSQISDSRHYYPISEAGKTYYVQPWIGWFADAGALLIGFIFFLLALITYLKRDQIERRR